MRLLRLALLVLLSACVTTADSPVDAAFTSAYAPPAVRVRVTDAEELPGTYDLAFREAGLTRAGAPLDGSAAAWVERTLAERLGEQLSPAYTGRRRAQLEVAVVNVILPDATRFTPLSGMKSFAVEARLLDGEGRVLAETTRPFTVLSEMQKRRFGRSAWSRLGETDRLRVEAVMSLTESAALVIADAMTGGSVQTGLSGGFTAYPERIGGR
ncbi:hypothetical protein [Parvularcula oceani]|uniref:hypothetical protein n=1 Tax=Parvularcula oceani TaxID=1247963 RepID=UPI0004E1504E|nr:hypothetical protein [Parvularcula oceani]